MEMKKSLIGRKTVTFICDECGGEGLKAKTEYERNIKLGRKNYCCRECAAKGAAKSRTGVKSQLLKLSLHTISRLQITEKMNTLRIATP